MCSLYTTSISQGIAVNLAKKGPWNFGEWPGKASNQHDDKTSKYLDGHKISDQLEVKIHFAHWKENFLK
jgi:hypothetical protein